MTKKDKPLLTGIILAGGRGFRFGQDKALVKLNGKYLIERLIEIFTKIFDEIIISTNNPSAYEFTGIKAVKDIIPNKGPLVGLYSSLSESMNELNFVSACDMPFIKSSLIYHMVKRSETFDVVVPSLGEGKLEPLHALYKKSCLPAIKRALKTTDNARIISFYPHVRVYKMEKKEMIPYDPEIISFFNINTKEDFERAKALLRPSRYPSLDSGRGLS